MTTVAPNPHSPYADADPQYRHSFPTLTLLGDPAPGILAPTSCQRLAVVPDEPLRDAMADGTLPDGLCPGCIAAMQGAELPADTRPVTQCRTCPCFTEHDGLCSVCRQRAHDQWRSKQHTAAETSQPMGLNTLLAAADAPEVAEAYPCQIGVFCDDCGTTVVHDYIVDTGMTKGERLDVARRHLTANEDWDCGPAGDLCPSCKADEPGMCPACDTAAIERCVACGSCRCDTHEHCTRTA